MEFKLGHSSSHSIILRSSCLVKAISNHRHFNLHPQVCRCHIQGISSKGQISTKKILVHVVKEGETLISISKIYGVPESDIAAANKNIIDVDLVFEGQVQQLNIPSSTTGRLHMNKSETTRSPEFVSERATSLGLYKRCLNLKNSTVLSLEHLSSAKSTGYFLVLVPLIAFCIRCIMVALHRRIDEDLKQNALTELERHHHGSKRMRWKSALQDLRDPDELNTDSRPDNDHLMDDQDQMDSTDVSHSYSKLERDYEKFLSECGMSKWGYWRGGSPK